MICRIWPTAVDDFLRLRCREPFARERLGGLSAARVYRVRGPRGSVIVKESADPREARFFSLIAPALPPALAPPQVELSLIVQGVHWLVLEDIPHPLPRERWGADPELLEILARLHTLTLPALPDPFRPGWTTAMIEAALRWFPADGAGALAPKLHSLQRASQSLFLPLCAIAGDPNPTNWGVRDDGTLVLFDWERFGRGTPALDLAIVVPDLGDFGDFARVATAYLARRRQRNPSHPWDVASLTREIALAKAWSVVEFLSGLDPAVDQRGTATARQLTANLPAWFDLILAGV